MSGDLEKLDARDSCSDSETEFSNASSSHLSDSIVSESNDEVSSSESQESFKNSEDEDSALSKKSKVEESPINLAPPTMPVFGSAAKSIVSFNSFAGASKLPSKSLFTENNANSDAAESKGSDIKAQAMKVVTGEEDEDTLTSIKGKLFEFNPASKDWSEKGVGLLKLNVSKVNENQYRILMRTDGVQRLILNSRLFNGITVERLQEKNMRFSAYSLEGKIQTFLFRMKNAEDAKCIESSMKRAIGNAFSIQEENC